MDRHLNLFYSYHIEQSSLLCEDNLTRAFIQTLRMLSGPVRNRFLRSLFSMHQESAELAAYDYEQADFALQNHMDETISKNCARKHIVTIATSRPEEENGEPTEQKDVEGGSKPDAWVFDRDSLTYCLLFECKHGGNPVAKDQLLRHAKQWFGMAPAEVKDNTIPLAWQNVLRAKETTLAMQPELNQQERLVLEALEEFLGFFGYRLFKGFCFEKLRPRPTWQLRARDVPL